MNQTDTKIFPSLTLNELKDNKTNQESNWTKLNWEENS